MHLLASGWYYSGLSCDTQTALVLYAIPLTGDVIQFIIIDKLQAAACAMHITMHTPCMCHAHAVHMPYLQCCRHSVSSRALRTRLAISRISTRARLPSVITA